MVRTVVSRLREIATADDRSLTLFDRDLPGEAVVYFADPAEPGGVRPTGGRSIPP